MILFLNASVRPQSRTKKLADRVLAKCGQPYQELRLADLPYPVVDATYLSARDDLIARQEFNHPMFEWANQFARTEEIVIAAPYWDFSFPAVLKQYLEQINVVGITFRYTEDGQPVGLCHAAKLTYITTAGGLFCPDDFGFGYVQTLARSFYGIPDVTLIKASGLDIDGADEDAILEKALLESGI